MLISRSRRTLLAWLLVMASVWSAGAAGAALPKLVVVLMVDQLRYDYLERFAPQFAPDGFRRLTERGAFMTFARYDYAPTVTAPGHASVLGGATPALHGIVGNDWFDKRTRKTVYCVEDPSVEGVGVTGRKGQMSPRNFEGANLADQMRLHFGSKVVGLSMKDRGAILPAGKKPLGAYWFDPTSGAFVTSTYYTGELPAWVTAFNARQRAAEFVGRTWNRLVDEKFYTGPDDGPGEAPLTGEKKPVFPHTIARSAKEGYETIMPTPFGNELLAEFARAAVEGERLGAGGGPDLLCVSFSSNDYCGHKFGPHSHEAQDITLWLDRQLEAFFGWLDERLGAGNVWVVLTADHGVAPNPEHAVAQGLDGARVNEAELMLELMGALSARFGAGKYFLTPRIYDGNLHFDHDTLRDRGVSAEEAGGFIREWALSSGRYQAVYTRAQLLDGRAPGLLGRLILNGYHPRLGGDVVLVDKPFQIASTRPTGTTHGSPYGYDTHVPVLFHGAAFRPGRHAGEFYISDIAPTLAAALRIQEPPATMGKPFTLALSGE